MNTLMPVDRVEVQVLVDNATDNLSSVPSFVETEVAALGRRRRGSWVLGGSCLCCAAFGLSCLISVRKGVETRTLLFDAGPEDAVLEQNVSRLGVDLGLVEAIVLSHGHWDHGGGMLRALQLIRDRSGGREIPYYSHPDMFRTRAQKLPNGAMRLFEDVLARIARTVVIDAVRGNAGNARRCHELGSGFFAHGAERIFAAQQSEHIGALASSADELAQHIGPTGEDAMYYSNHKAAYLLGLALPAAAALAPCAFGGEISPERAGFGYAIHFTTGVTAEALLPVKRAALPDRPGFGYTITFLPSDPAGSLYPPGWAKQKSTAVARQN
jgi:hypothetical protein